MRVDTAILEHLFNLQGLDALDGLAQTCGAGALDMPPALIRKIILSPAYDEVKLARVLDLTPAEVADLARSVRASTAQGG